MRKFRNLVFSLALCGLTFFGGTTMRPDEIEDLLSAANRTEIVQMKENDGDDEGDRPVLRYSPASKRSRASPK